MALQARAARGQRQQRRAHQRRVFGEERGLPAIVGTMAVGERLRVDTARDHPHPARFQPAVVAEHVIAQRLRYRHHAFAAQQDGAVARGRVEPMHGGDEMRSRRQPLHRPPAQPRGQARARVHDVGAKLAQHAPQFAQPQQGEQRFAADIQGDVLAALGQQLRHQPAAGGNHHRAVPGLYQGTADLQRRPLRATRVHGGNQLDNGQQLVGRGGAGHGLMFRGVDRRRQAETMPPIASRRARGQSRNT